MFILIVVHWAWARHEVGAEWWPQFHAFFIQNLRFLLFLCDKSLIIKEAERLLGLRWNEVQCGDHWGSFHFSVLVPVFRNFSEFRKSDAESEILAYSFKSDVHVFHSAVCGVFSEIFPSFQKMFQSLATVSASCLSQQGGTQQKFGIHGISWERKWNKSTIMQSYFFIK